MRAFLLACLALVVICVGGYFVLSAVQQPTGVAFAADGTTRIDTSWSWRSLLSTTSVDGTKTLETEPCDMHKDWQWIVIDFGRHNGACWASQ